MCEPIAALVQSLHHLGFTTIEQKVSDYHFSELYIKMKGKHNNEIDTINIPQIQRNKRLYFYVFVPLIKSINDFATGSIIFSLSS